MRAIKLLSSIEIGWLFALGSYHKKIWGGGGGAIPNARGRGCGVGQHNSKDKHKSGILILSLFYVTIV